MGDYTLFACVRELVWNSTKDQRWASRVWVFDNLVSEGVIGSTKSELDALYHELRKEDRFFSYT